MHSKSEILAKLGPVTALSCLALVIVWMFVVSPTTAQVEKGVGAKRWEYCSIYLVVSLRPGMVSKNGLITIKYANEGNSRSETIEAPVRDFNDNAPIMKAIAKLGNEGWEMVGEVFHPSSEERVLYFKRPQP